jgi:hypothetical protein
MRFCWRVMWLPEHVLLQVIVFFVCLGLHLEFLSSLAVSFGAAWAIGAIGADFPLGRDWLQRCIHCSGQESLRQELRERCGNGCSTDDFISSFNRLSSIAQKGMVLSLLRAGMSFIALVIPVMAFGLGGLDRYVPIPWISTQPARFEMGALMGTFLLILIAHLTLPRATRTSPILFTCAVVAVILAAVYIVVSAAGYIVVPSLGLDPEMAAAGHALAVLAASVFWLLYDVHALYSLKSGSDQKGIREMLKMCLLVDLPVAFSFACLFAFWLLAGDTMGAKEEAQGFVGGAIVMQFLVSAALFFLVKYRVADDQTPEEEADSARTAGAGAGGEA